MTRDEERLRHILLEGKCCSAALVQLALEELKREDPLLLQAASALCMGVRSGALCGAATGAACLLAMLCPEYAATELIPELMDWFEDQCAQRFGGVCCRDIVGQDALKRKMICPGLVADTYGKARELLEEYGYQFEA